jgi:hypothetical protein
MSGQAERLQQTMSFFKLSGSAQGKPPAFALHRNPGKVAGRGNAPKVQGNLAVAASTAVDETKFVKF